MASTRSIVTRTVDTPGASICYDVHGDPADATSSRPVLLLVGSPMEALGFGTLASLLTDRPVVTYDPRGVGRSRRTDGSTESTPEQHAEDLVRVVEALDVAPVDVFASSGGAVNALAMVAARPDLVRTLVAHEPPLAEYLPDRDQVLAVNADIADTYRRDGYGAAMAKFFTFVSVEGPIPADHVGRPAPDPAAMGLLVQDDGSRDDPLLGQNIRTCVPYVPDLEALREAATRVVVAAGVESAELVTGRAAAALAKRLGTGLVVFPSHHGGFLGGEFGQQGEPEAFGARLRTVLDQS